MTALSAVRIRPMAPSDMAFVCSSWKKCWKHPRANHLPRGLVTEHSGHERPTRQGWALLNYVIDHVSLPRCLVLVAYSPATATEPEGSHAWIAVHGKRLVYGYTKPDFRHMGLHRMLREEAPNAVWSGFDAILELENVRSVA